jgi:copper(I)-binding protein
MKTLILPTAALLRRSRCPHSPPYLAQERLDASCAFRKTAAVYVDITSDVPLKLVGGKTSVAKAVGFVLVDQNPDGTTTEHPVKEADIPAGQQTRFAYNGSRIELRDIVEDVNPGGNVPLTLEFVEPKGARHSIEIGVLVRGVILPPAAAPGQTSEAPK